MNTDILASITTRDSAGRHFTELYPASELAELEKAGLLAIERPVHESGTPFAQEYWTVEVTEDGLQYVDTL